MCREKNTIAKGGRDGRQGQQLARACAPGFQPPVSSVQHRESTRHCCRVETSATHWKQTTAVPPTRHWNGGSSARTFSALHLLRVAASPLRLDFERLEGLRSEKVFRLQQALREALL